MFAAAVAITFVVASSAVSGLPWMPVLLTTLHVIAAALCIDRARRAAALPCSDAATGRAKGLWLAVASSASVLVASRVTGSLPALTQLGRDLAGEQGWYDHRRPVQALALSVMAIAAAAAAPAVLRAIRHQAPALRRAIAAAIVLLGMIVLRAVSLHQVEHLLAAGAGGLNIGHVVEVAAALTIILASPDAAAAHRAIAPTSCSG